MGIVTPTSIRYHFQQHFDFSAREAFDWCTSFEPQDHQLMGEENAKRQITRIANGTIILTDTFRAASGVLEKQKLVQLYPEQLSWTSTHLTGPNKYSQFTYKISPDGRSASILDFTAIHLEYGESLGRKEAIKLADQLCREDSNAWKLLAQAMAKDHGQLL